jgi:serine/threonine protein phosphatase PrpC
MGHGFRHVLAFASNRVRTEDAAEVFDRGDTVVVVVADGAGGIRGGATASSALVAAVKGTVSEPRLALTDKRLWADLLRTTDEVLAEKRAGEAAGVVVAVGPFGLVGASTGDSEAWMVTATGVDDLTVGQQTKRRLGSGRVIPETFERPRLDGVLVVATDGLCKYAALDVIARVVRSDPIGVASEGLLELVRLPSGKFADDVAMVLVSADAAN